MKKPFSDNKLGMAIKSHQIKVLVIGDSFGNEVANDLLESSFKNTIS